ncbi:ATP-binding protein [Gangjinia marincola]|uniref:histidine kinase n=1 Tax=Gangjinia marincola TaxID=578463 RepID=A0ABP3XY21_9FLAO
MLKNIFVILTSLYVGISYGQFRISEDPVEKDEIQLLLDDAYQASQDWDIEEAIAKLDEARDLARQKEDKTSIAHVSEVIAKLHEDRGDYARAIAEIRNAIAIHQELKDQNHLAENYIQLSSLFISQKKFKTAQTYLDLAASIYKTQRDTDNIALIDLNRGILFLYQKQPEEALKYLKKAEDKVVLSNNKFQIASLYYNMANAYFLNQELKLAEDYANNAYKISQDNNYKTNILESYQLLSDISAAKGEYMKALIFLTNSNNYRDSIFNAQKQTIAEKATAKYELSSARDMISDLSEEKKKNEKTIKFTQLASILSVALIVILSLLTISLYKNNNLRAKANNLLSDKNTELTDAKEKAERASQSKAEFLSTISHELRTPLYAVTGLTHLLLQENPTKEQKEHLKSLKFSGEYLLSLINNILDLNKLEAQKVEITEAPFNLQKRVKDVLVTLEKSAKDRGNNFNYVFDPTIPKRVKGDPLVVSQILINLVGNAIKFTENGEISIKISKSSETKNHVNLLFEIQDSGKGISREHQERIFENFSQGSVEINRKYGGTGLGLSIVRNLLVLLGSEIKLTSELEKGSNFFFDLKFEKVAQDEITKKSPAVDDIFLGDLSETEITSLLTNKRILIVEDNKINQMITKKILLKHDAICEVVDDGKYAIEAMRKNEYDLVLMDIHMPEVGGIEATQTIRQFDKTTPILALTAVSMTDDLNEFFSNGFDEVIPKPYKTEEFFSKICAKVKTEKIT